MKKLLIALSTIALLFAAPASAQAPAGLNPGNFVAQNNSNGDTGGASITLGDASHITWVCGFSISGLGATAATAASVTLGPFTTTSGSTVNMNFEYTFVAGATVATTPTQQNFTPCLPVAGAATLTVGGAAGNTQTNIAMWGYKQ